MEEIRKVVFQRDRYRCQYPKFRGKVQTVFVCGSPAGLQHHHIEHRSQGGDDVAENLITLCMEHHTDERVAMIDWTRFDRESGVWE